MPGRPLLFERGTLNADRKANRKGAACSKALPHGASSKSQLRNSKSQSQCNREERQRDLKQRCLSLGPSPRLLHSSPDVGSSLGRAGIAGEVVVFKSTFDPVLGHAIDVIGDTD